jgi:gamma-glutamyl hercynylcysteine S-oxide synthase
LIDTHVSGDSVYIRKRGNGRIIVWKGNPSFQADHFELNNREDTVVSVMNNFGYYEGKIVIQYLEGDILGDERIETIKGGRPWKISKVNRTQEAHSIPPDMVFVPGAEIEYTLTTREDFIPYPAKDETVKVNVDSYLIDRYPVTNSQFYDFLITSGYVPEDTTNFLKHWENGMFRQGQEKYPVVYVCYEDMEAYAKWAGKRLPTEAEWQMAAQGTDGRKWPWGNEFRGTWCNNAFDRPTPVDAFSKGASPYGVIDMVGNVWQMTGDKYFNGINYLTVIRGGSYYMPESSSWYIQGGPQSLDRNQIMLMVSPGFDRSATVGFRCVKDVDPASFNQRR